MKREARSVCECKNPARFAKIPRLFQNGNQHNLSALAKNQNDQKPEIPYVTISRGKKGIHIFTTDKEQLRENITRSGDRPSVVDALIAHYRKHDSFYRMIEQRWGQRAALTMTNSKRAREFRELRQRRNQSQSQTEIVKIEPDEIRQPPAQKLSQPPAGETAAPKIKPHLIPPEVPKKQSRGYRP